MNAISRWMHMGVFVLGTGNHIAGWRFPGAATSNMEHPVIQEIARVFSSIDHISGGRAAWNVVISSNPKVALNFNLDAHLAHELRHERANECVESSKVSGIAGTTARLLQTRQPAGSSTRARSVASTTKGGSFRSRDRSI